MITNTNTISKFQLFFFIIQTQIGIGLLSLPHVVESTAKGDGWISTIIAGIAVQIALIIYWLLSKQYPNKMYTEITSKILGKYIGKLLNLVILLYFISTGSLALILYIQCINLWLLPLTPSWVLSIVILLACIYLAISDLRIIARFFVLASFLFFLLIVLSLLTFNFPKVMDYILPIGNSGIKNILLGSNKSLLSMLGFEGLLLIFPFIQSKEKGVFKTITIANLFVTSLYTYFLFICLISFSPNQLMQLREPVLFLFEVLSYQMIDRLDLLFVSIWIVPMTTSVIAYLFFASKSISKDKSYKRNILIIGLLVFLISLYPFDEKKLTLFNDFVTYLGYAVIFALPLILLSISFLIKKWDRSQNL